MVRWLSHPWFGPMRDAAAVYLAAATVFALADGYRAWEVVVLAAIASALQVGWFVAADVYDTSHPRVARPPYAHLLRGLIWVLLTYLATHFVTNGEPERRTIVFAFGATAGAIAVTYLARAVALLALQRRGAFRERLLIVGADQQAERVAEQLTSDGSHALDVVGVLDEFSPRSSRVGGVEVLGDPLELEAVVDRHAVTSVMVVASAVSWEAQEYVMQVAAQRPALRVFMVAGIHDLLSSEVVAARDGMPSLVRLRPAQLRRSEAVMKRAMDIGIALALMPALALVLLFARLRGGPVFRTVEVLGRGGRIVRMRLLAPRPAPGGGRPVPGRAEKMPALLGVLKGDLSIVGPRPLPASAATGRDPWRSRLLLMPPGLTGPWNSAHADLGTTLLDDLAYLRTYSVWADVKLILLSVQRTVTGGSAVPALREFPEAPPTGG
ncbi:MAG: hypothetical protein AMXMBFR23_07890 [Chloroflexota bacterium]